MAVLAAASLLGAEPMATKGEDGGLVIGVREPAAQEAAEISVAVRRYGIREDPKTGRLVRVNAGRKVRTVPAARSATVAAGLEGVQVLSSESAGKSPGSVELESLVQEAGRRHDVDPELIRAVMRQESGFNPLAVSRKGAQGLMQLMPETAKRLGVQDVFDPAENVLGGAKLLRQLMDRYQGDLDLALAAYNAGEGAVEKYGGLPPYRETVDYVGRITQAYGLVARADSEAVTQSIVPKPRIRAVEGLDGSLVFETE